MSCKLAGAHQLKDSNTTEAGSSVKTQMGETRGNRQLLGIHYSFASGSQENGRRIKQKASFTLFAFGKTVNSIREFRYRIAPTRAVP